MSNKEHSPIGASGAHRWMNCPGSVKLSAKLPPQPTSPKAEEGTAAHFLAEEVFKSQGKAHDFLGKMFNGFKVTRPMAKHVQQYVDYVLRVKNDVEGEIFFEKRFHLTHLHPLLFGTCDAIVFKDDQLHVFDFKFGKSIAVEAESNEQMLFYALGALDLGDFKKIKLHIVQPRAKHSKGPFRTWDTDIDFLLKFSETLKEKAILTQADKSPLITGAWCQWCPAEMICSANRGINWGD